jgi:tetratricopeptide (TPR) repeat protein
MRKKKIIIPCIVALSLFLNVVVYYTVSAKEYNFYKYPYFASQYLNNTYTPERLFDFSPLYLYVHIFTQKTVSKSPEVILWMQFLLTAFSSVFLFLLIDSFFGFFIGLTGAIAFVLSRSILIYAGVLEPEPFLTFFLLGYIVCALRKSYRMALFAGLFLCLSLLTRLNLLPLMFITPLFFYLTKEKTTLFFRRTVLFLAPVCIGLLCLSIRNHSINGLFTPVTMNPGYVFYEGNNPLSIGESGNYPVMVCKMIAQHADGPDYAHVVYRSFARNISGKDLSISEVNSFWAHKAANFIMDHPAHWLNNIGIKTYFFFHDFRHHDISYLVRIEQGLHKIPFPFIPFGLISAMALIGMILMYRSWKKLLILYAVFICQFGVMLLTYVSERQRICILPLFIFFAAGTLWAIIHKKYLRYHKIIIVLAAAILFPFLYLKNDRIKDYIYLKSLQWPAKGTPPEIAETFYKGEKGHSARLDLAILYLETGKLDQAETILNDLIQKHHKFFRMYRHSSEPEYYLSRIYELKRMKPQALAHLKNAYTNNPGDPWVLAHLAVLTGDMSYKNDLVRYFEEIDAAFFMGQAYVADGQVEAAKNSFSYIFRIDPKFQLEKDEP